MTLKLWPMLLILWLPPSLAQTDNAPSLEYPSMEQFGTMLERPLFKASRRPDQGENNTQGENASEIRQKWRLSGVVWKNGQQLALFSERKGQGRQRIRTGMYLDGNWQLEKITKDSVTLTDEERRLQLQLWEPRQASTRSLPKPLASQDDAGERPQATEQNNGDEPATEQGSNGESS